MNDFWIETGVGFLIFVCAVAGFAFLSFGVGSAVVYLTGPVVIPVGMSPFAVTTMLGVTWVGGLILLFVISWAIGRTIRN